MRAWLLAILVATAPHAAGAQADSPNDILAIRQLLVAHDWAGLRRELEVRRPSSPTEMQGESRFVFAFDAFVTGNSTLLRHLDAWVAAEPAAAMPRVARGIFYLQLAGVESSQAPDDNPNDPHARNASRWQARAREEAQAAIRLDSNEVMGHLLMLEMSPQIHDSRAESALASATQIWPGSLLARTAFFESLIPRFGGSFARMQAFADSSQRLVPLNPRLRVLRAMPEFDRGRELAYENQHAKAIVAFTRAIAVQDYWLFRYMRGMEYYRTGDLHRALVDLNRAVAGRPGYARAVAGRAVMLKRLARPLRAGGVSAMDRRAETDRSLALALNSADKEVQYIVGEGPETPDAAATRVPVVVKLDPAPPLDRTEDLLALRRLLVTHDFTRLDSAFAARAAEARADIARETRYLYAFDIFETADSSIAPHLDAWIAHDSSRAVPWAARSAHFNARAQQARGGAFAAKVKDEQWKDMHDWLARAVPDAARAARLDRADVAAHQVMLGVTLLGSAGAPRSWVLEDALARQPASLALRANFMSSLRPRWGGSLQALDDFAAAAQQGVRANPRLTVLLGMADFDRGEAFWDNDEYQAAVSQYTKALSHGDYWRYYYRRGRAFLHMAEPEKALLDLDRAVNRRPGAADLLAYRAVAYSDLADLEVGEAAAALLRNGQRDLRAALILDSADVDVRWVRRNYPGLSPAQN